MARRYRYTRIRRAHVVLATAVLAASGVGVAVLGRGDAAPDVSLPSLFLSAPTGGTVSGSVTVSATCGDNVGCAGVTFKLDGAAITGVVEDTSAPFSINWDTSTAGAGSHVLTATGRDAAGNTKTSAGVTVSVSTAFAANVYTAQVGTSGATPTCTASPTPISYAVALAGGNVCAPDATGTALDKACLATKTLSSATGAAIGMKSGAYDVVNNKMMQGYFIGNEDCSGGKGGDYNPNYDPARLGDRQPAAAGSTVGWVTVKCADTSGLVEFTNLPQGTTFAGDTAGGGYHLIFQFDACARTDSRTFIGLGGGDQPIKNVWFYSPTTGSRMQFYSFDISGTINVYLHHIGVGPSLACGKNDANVPIEDRCNPAGPWWEAEWANYGTATSSCAYANAGACGGSLSVSSTLGENFLHSGSGIEPTATRLDDVYIHDQQAVDGGYGNHPGGILNPNQGSGQAAGAVIIDHLVCERVAVFCMEYHQDGLLLQNGWIGPATQMLDASGGVWATPANGQNAIGIGTGGGAPCTLYSNAIVRHMSFATGIGNAMGWGCGTFTNVRIIGNSFGKGSGCAGAPAGVSYAYNYFASATGYTGGCDSNPSTSFGSDPYVDSDPGTALPAPTDSAPFQLNLGLSGSPVMPTMPNAGLPNSDYSLDHDATGTARGTSTTHIGAAG